MVVFMPVLRPARCDFVSEIEEATRLPGLHELGLCEPIGRNSSPGYSEETQNLPASRLGSWRAIDVASSERTVGQNNPETIWKNQ